MNTTSAVEKREKAVDYVSDEGNSVYIGTNYPLNETIHRRSVDIPWKYHLIFWLNRSLLL